MSPVGKFNPTEDSNLLKVKLVVMMIMTALGNSSLLFIRHCSKCFVIINPCNPHNNTAMVTIPLPSPCFTCKATTAVKSLAQAGERLD